MTTAVLKNRLLNSTNGKFNQEDFGVSSMVEFARLFPRDLEVDTRSTHPLVRLTRPETLPASSTADNDSTEKSAPYKKIRPDLWRAAVDYRSGSTYVWDDIAGLARMANVDDTSPVVPTATDTDVAKWRQAFADAVRSELSSDDVVKRLDEWLRHSYGSGFLPTKLRGRWNEFSRNKIEMRLRNFFESQELTIPDDLVIPAGERPTRNLKSAQLSRTNDLPHLRSLVQRCVAVMTEQELAELRISPAVMLRATRGRS